MRNGIINRVLVLLAVLATMGCSRNNESCMVVSMSPVLDMEQFISRVDSISLVPLRNDENHMLGSMVEMAFNSSGYYLVDKRNSRIYHYSPEGEFLNQIGQKGNAKREYLNIQDIQLVGGNVVVYSYPGKVTVYNPNGEFINTKTNKRLGERTWLAGEHLLTYYGYSSKDKYRFASLLSKEVEFEALKTKTPLMPYDFQEPLFSQFGDRIVMQDAYSNILYEVTPLSCEPYISFDFGKYAICEQFFETEDIFKGAEILLSSPFAHISRYIESEKLKVVAVIVQGDESLSQLMGLESDNVWKWYSMGSSGIDPFAGTLRGVEGMCLYYLLELEQIEKFAKNIRNKVTNLHVLNNELDTNDYVVAKVSIH